MSDLPYSVVIRVTDNGLYPSKYTTSFFLTMREAGDSYIEAHEVFGKERDSLKVGVPPGTWHEPMGVYHNGHRMDDMNFLYWHIMKPIDFTKGK